MKNILLVVLSLAVAAGLLEGTARMVGLKPRVAKINQFFIPGADTTWSVPDPELGWVSKPGVSRSLEEGHAMMTFWDNGRRASRPDPTLPADGIGVMVLGGSNAQSYGVRDEDSFIYRLAARYPQLWFENFGGGGYSTVQALMMAKRAYANFYRDRKPRLILLAFDDSHALRNVADQSWIFSISDQQGNYVVPPHDRLENGKLKFYPFQTIGYWPLEKVSALVTAVHDAWLKTVAYNTAAQALPVTRRVIADLAAYAHEQGAMFAVVVLEDRTQIATTLFANQPFPYVDCSGPGRNEPEEYLLGGNSHPNAKLHAYFTDCVATWLDAEVIPKLEAAAPTP